MGRGAGHRAAAAALEEHDQRLRGSGLEAGQQQADAGQHGGVRAVVPIRRGVRGSRHNGRARCLHQHRALRERRHAARTSAARASTSARASANAALPRRGASDGQRSSQSRSKRRSRCARPSSMSFCRFLLSPVAERTARRRRDGEPAATFDFLPLLFGDSRGRVVFF